MNNKIKFGFVIFFFFLLNITFAQNKKVNIPLSFDYYYDNAMLIDALKLLNHTYPNLTELNLDFLPTYKAPLVPLGIKLNPETSAVVAALAE